MLDFEFLPYWFRWVIFLYLIIVAMFLLNNIVNNFINSSKEKDNCYYINDIKYCRVD